MSEMQKQQKEKKYEFNHYFKPIIIWDITTREPRNIQEENAKWSSIEGSMLWRIFAEVKGVTVKLWGVWSKEEGYMEECKVGKSI